MNPSNFTTNDTEYILSDIIKTLDSMNITYTCDTDNEISDDRLNILKHNTNTCGPSIARFNGNKKNNKFYIGNIRHFKRSSTQQCQ